MKLERHNLFAILIGSLGLLITILSTVAMVTWKASSIDRELDKRISILETTQIINSQKFNDLKSLNDQENAEQDQNLIRFQEQIFASMNRIEDRIEKIYQVMRPTR